MKAAFLSRFTPSSMKPEDLEAMFVQREELAERLVESITDSALTPSKHHVLLVGPRGIGKTHLVALTYHRVRAVEDIRDRLLIAWLREEEWGVTSFLDLLLRIFRALLEESNDEELAERVESLYDLPPDTVEQMAAELLKEFVGDRTLLILMENLEDLFGGLGDEGQKQLRAYLQENPFCTILATAQSLFNGMSRQTSPFYGFFRVHHLEALDLEGAILLLTKIADLENDKDLAFFITTPQGRARIRAVRHLAGDSHRVYVIFSQFLTRESLDELVESVMRMLDDLTPYYQSRMMFLSPQQRKIVEFLIDRRSAVPVKEIAGRCFMTHQTASSQLKVLRDMGYVSSISIGRESYYELREPLMRLCAEVKKQRGDPIRLLVDFLRLWYSQEELEQRLTSLGPEATVDREYILNALKIAEGEAADPLLVACMKDCFTFLKAGNPTSALAAVEELVDFRDEASDWILRGFCLAALERLDESLESLDKAVKSEPNNVRIWHACGIVLGDLGRYEEALESYDKAIELGLDHTMVWHDRGVMLAGLGRHEEALEFSDKAIELDPDHVMAWRNRGEVLVKLGRHEEALESYNRAIELEPDHALAWYSRASILISLERYEEALESLDKVVELEPDDALYWYSRGSALVALERYEEALECFDRETEPDLSNAEIRTIQVNIRILQGMILGVLGQYSKALESYDKALELGDQSATVFFSRAAALLALNRWDEGIAVLNDALQRFAQADEPDTGDLTAIIRNLFTLTPDPAGWQERITMLVELYNEHKVLASLGQGLVGSIPALNSPMVSDAAAQMWLDAWKAAAGDHDEFQIPLRLLDAAVRYRETHDQRVLLGLPIEERKLLESLLEGSDTP